MIEEWEFVGHGSDSLPFEIVPGVNVWDHPWYREGEPVQIGPSVTGPFLYLPVFVIRFDGRRIEFAAADIRMGQYVFYLRK